jgi:hypothetical protein
MLCVEHTGPQPLWHPEVSHGQVGGWLARAKMMSEHMLILCACCYRSSTIVDSRGYLLPSELPGMRASYCAMVVLILAGMRQVSTRSATALPPKYLCMARHLHGGLRCANTACATTHAAGLTQRPPCSAGELRYSIRSTLHDGLQGYQHM